jgi:large-conductance mechanosensitive channel
MLTHTIAFIARDNVLEVALGLIIGAAFSGVVTSLVSDIILPPLSLLSATSRNLESHFTVLRKGETPDAMYNTVEQAAADGKIPLFALLADHIRSRLHGVGSFSTKSMSNLKPPLGVVLTIKCIDFLTLGLALYCAVQRRFRFNSDTLIR